MPRRGSTHRGRASKSGLGKRRRNAASESADSEDEPRASGQGRVRQSGARARAKGRNQRPRVSRESVTAVRDKSTTTTTTTVTSTKSGPYDRAFTQHLLNHHVLPLEHLFSDGKMPEPPDNMHEIEDDLGAVRAPEPAEDFESFQKQYRRCSNEDDAVRLLDTLEGDSAALLQSHIIRQKKKMSNLTPLTDWNTVPGNPDRAYGAAATDLDISVRKLLDGVVVPTGDKDFICPNFVVHVKSDSGSVRVARNQAAYDGALAARGMQDLWNFGNRPGDVLPWAHTRGSDGGRSTAVLGALSGNLKHSGPAQGQAQVARVARTITCTWTTGVLKMYAIYRETNPDTGEEVPSDGLAPHERPKYVSSLIGSWIMTDKKDDFLRGVTAYRNGLDWAKRQRDEVISRANARVQADEARRRRGEEEDLGGEHIADEQDPEPRESPGGDDEDSGSTHARRGPEIRDLDEEGQSVGEETYEGGADSSSISVRQRSHAREQDEEGQPEGEDNDEEGGADSRSIFAGRRSDTRGQDEEDEDEEDEDEEDEDEEDEDEEDEDELNFHSFDSSRTMTQSMYRKF